MFSPGASRSPGIEGARESSMADQPQEITTLATQAHTGRGLLTVHAATLLFGLAGVLGRMTGLPAPLITLGRVVFAGLALGVTVVFTRTPLRPKRRADLALLI